MIRIEKYNKVLDSRWMKLFPAADLTEDQRGRLDQFVQMDFVLENVSGQRIEDLLRDILSPLMATHDIRFVFMESIPQRKSSIRSHKKYFFDIRKDIAPADRYEVEVDTGNDQSLMAGLIHLTESNLDYCIENMTGANFRFAYLVKRISVPSPDWEQFLRQIADCRLPGSTQTVLHLPRIIADFADDTRSLMRLVSTGRDEEIVQCWVIDEDVRRVLDELETRARAEINNGSGERVPIREQEFHKLLQKLNDIELGLGAHVAEGWQGQYRRMYRFFERYVSAVEFADKLDFAAAFFVFSYSLRDWIRNHEYPDREAKKVFDRKWEKFQKENRVIKISRDINNIMKHLSISQVSLDKKFMLFWEISDIFTGEKDFTIIYSGRKERLVDLMAKVIYAWGDFIADELSLEY